MGREAGTRAYWCLFCTAVVFVAAFDAMLLDQLRGYFRSGFNSPALRQAGPRSAFAILSMLQDAALLLAIAAPLRWWWRRRESLVATISILALPVAAVLIADLVIYRVYRVFGEILSWRVLIELAGGARGATTEAISDQPLAAASIALALLALAAAIWATARGLRASGVSSIPAPPPSHLAGLSLFLTIVATTGLVGSITAAPTLHAGLAFKPSGRAILGALRELTDLDRDGAGWSDRPPDPAPFDPTRHPFALEIPGNGIDENGLAGDLPALVRPPDAHATSLPQLGDTTRPDVLLILLETFRADLIGAELQGRPVTPFLNRLAEAHGSTREAWTHSPATAAARGQLFQGRIAPGAGAATLIDDFNELGYETAYFSGQNDSFRGSRELIGWDRAEHFFDARQSDVTTSRTRSAVSLQVSWRTLRDEIERFLPSRDPARPLFLYVNIVDAHYPYDHPELDRILPGDPVTREEIRPEHRERLVSTYMNAAANVDRAAEEIVTLFEATAPGRRQAILVTADHGQAFYERGQLGHGQDLDRPQAGVPLIVRGLGGAWPEPIGLSDLRPLILEGLGDPRDPTFIADPARTILLYTRSFARPARVAHRHLAGSEVFDFGSGAAFRRDERDDTIGDLGQAARSRLIRDWERERWLDEARAEP